MKINLKFLNKIIRIAYGCRIDVFLEHSDLTEIILDSCFNVMNDLGVGVLINFGKRNIQYKHLCHPDYYRAAVGDPAHFDQYFFNLIVQPDLDFSLPTLYNSFHKRIETKVNIRTDKGVPFRPFNSRVFYGRVKGASICNW